MTGLWAVGLTTAPAQEQVAEMDEIPITELETVEEPVASLQGGLDVVVTGTRTIETSPIDVPQTINAVTREDLDRKVYKDVDEAIRRFPNIGYAPAEGNANYWQEGFSIRGLGAQRVLVLTDGVRQSGQGVGYGGGNLNLYDMFGIERIEVLRGPASVLYGTDSFGGVINIITRKPMERTEPGVNGGVRYEYDSGYDAHRAGFYGDVGNEHGGLVFGGTAESSGQPNLPDGEAPNQGDFDQYGFWGKADYWISDNARLRILGNWDLTQDVTISENTPGPFGVPIDFDLPTYERWMVGAELEVTDINEWFVQYNTGIYWQQLNREFQRESAFTLGGFPTFGPPGATTSAAYLSTVDTDDTVNTWEWQNVAVLQFGDHELTVGTDLGFDQADLPETEVQSFLFPTGPPAIGGFPATITNERNRSDALQTRFGVFAQDRWDLYPFALISGVRADFFDVEDDASGQSANGAGVSGTLSGLYYHSDTQSSFVTLASGYRYPDIGERFQDTFVNIGSLNRVIGNPDLDPERAWSAEIGTKGETEHWYYEAALFYNHIQDFVGQVGLGNINGVNTTQFANVGTVNLYGVEVAGAYRFGNGFELQANASRTYTEDSQKVDVADWTFNYGVGYNHDGWGWIEEWTTALLFRTVLDSESHTATNFEFPTEAGFTVLDWELNILLQDGPLGQWSALLGVRNLFDEKYEEPFFNARQPGRSLYTAIQLEF